MDSRKKKIIDAAQEALEVKQNIKEYNVNIRLIESEIIQSKNKIIQLGEQMKWNNQKIDKYKNLEKEIKKFKKSMYIDCGIGFIPAVVMAAIFGFSSYGFVVFALTGIVFTGCHIAHLMKKIKNKNDLRNFENEKAKDEEDLKVKIEKENKSIRKSILKEERHKSNLDTNRNFLESQKTTLQEHYQYLIEQTKTLTAERRNLADALLEEHECPVIDLNKSFYKGKRIK